MNDSEIRKSWVSNDMDRMTRSVMKLQAGIEKINLCTYRVPQSICTVRMIVGADAVCVHR